VRAENITFIHFEVTLFVSTTFTARRVVLVNFHRAAKPREEWRNSKSRDDHWNGIPIGNGNSVGMGLWQICHL